MLGIHIKKKLDLFSLDAEFTLKKSGITVISGPSGAGKSTVINMVAGLINPDKGYIRFNGREMFNSAEKINIPPEKRQFGYVFQDDRLFPHLSVKSNLAYGMKSPKKNLITMEHVIDLLGLGELLRRRPANLSGGEKKRVAIGRALLSSPNLLLMDEPLSSLDERRKNEILPYIAKLPQNLSIPVLYVTHSKREINALADKVILLKEGSVVKTMVRIG